MRIRLDECLPRRLRRALPGHEVETVPEAGWAGVSNGDLHRRAASTFDVFMTVDRNLAVQQEFAAMDLAVVVLVASSNDIEDLRPLMPEVMRLLPTLRRGAIVRVGT